MKSYYARELAEVGARGGGEPLPHLEVIQKAFGAHDVRSIVAHLGSAAPRAIGAEAYARGEHVVFSGSPSLRLAAHEAAHVVQQRGAQIADGVGSDGDAHERHAEAVADRVEKGESAEALLDQYGPPGGRVASPAVQRATTSWGSNITYSWELEGKAPRIFDYYYDASRFSPSDWERMRWTRKPQAWFWGNHWEILRTSFPRFYNRYSDDQWLRLGNSPIDRTNAEMDGLGLLQFYLAHICKQRFRGLKKLASAPAYFRDELLDEGDGFSIWETTHRGYETALSPIFRQVDFNRANLTQEPNYHFHLAFRRPAFANQAERDFWGQKIAEMAAHLNDYTALRTMEQDNGRHISGKYLGAFSDEAVTELEHRIAMPQIPRGAEHGLEETDAEGHNLGMFKFGGVALRQTYNRKTDPYALIDRTKYPDPEILGFEFRAQHDLGATQQIMTAVTQILEHFPQLTSVRHPRNNFGTGPAGREGARYSPTRMTRMHPSAQVFVQLNAAGGQSQDAARVVDLALAHVPPGTTLPWVMQGDPTLTGPNQAANQKEALKIRWSIAFLPWETHEMVPANERAAIIAERTALIGRLAALWAQHQAAPPPTLYQNIQSELSAWARRAHIWRYF